MVEVTLRVVCEECGEELQATLDMSKTFSERDPITVSVTPCKSCLDESYRHGQEDDNE
jgi:hypothetical protein